MGRGRAKAKQTKVARELKYSTGGTDLDRLRAELVGAPARPPEPVSTDDDLDDLIARYADEDDEADDEDSDDAGGQPR